MSGKSFEDRLRNKLMNYDSPLSKEEMYQDFLLRTEERKKRRIGAWLWLPIMASFFLLIGYFLLEGMLSERNTLSANQDLAQQHRGTTVSAENQSSTRFTSNVNSLRATSKNKKVAPATYSHVSASSQATNKERTDRPQLYAEKGTPTKPIDTKLKQKGLLKNREGRQGASMKLPQRTLSPLVPYLELRQTFLFTPEPSINPYFSYNSGHSIIKNKDQKEWKKTAHLTFSYDYMDAKKISDQTFSNQIDRLAVNLGQEWQSPNKWLYGIQVGFIRYNLVQDGKALLESSYDTLAVSEMLSMVQASLNGLLPPTSSTLETGYSLVQYQNAMQLGTSLGRLISVSKKLDLEMGARLSAEYVWRSNGEWNNPDRGVFLDYNFADYNALVATVAGHFGVRLNLTDQNMLRVGMNAQRDISDRRADHEVFRQYRGLGFYLSLSKLLE